MPFSSENLLRELDQRRRIDWAPELKSRKDGFAFLVQAVRGGRLNKSQFRNALHMLYRMAFPEYANEVLQILVDFTAHSDIAVRSEAVQLAVGLVHASKGLKTPIDFSDAQRKLVRKALNLGVRKKVAHWVSKFSSI
jgi:hypothetical protein